MAQVYWIHNFTLSCHSIHSFIGYSSYKQRPWSLTRVALHTGFTVLHLREFEKSYSIALPSSINWGDHGI